VVLASRSGADFSWQFLTVIVQETGAPIQESAPILLVPDVLSATMRGRNTLDLFLHLTASSGLPPPHAVFAHGASQIVFSLR
jgi:hypothetical protein